MKSWIIEVYDVNTKTWVQQGKPMEFDKAYEGAQRMIAAGNKARVRRV